MKKIAILVALLIVVAISTVACRGPMKEKSDAVQTRQQESLVSEAIKAVGMPNIVNFRERKILKQVLELRDQEGLITYTYLYSEMTGKLTFFGETVGYGIPYATQYTNPQKFDFAWLDNGWSTRENRYAEGILPQADPNGLFSPSSAEGTWVLMYDPVSKEALPQYVEPRMITLTYKLKPDDPRLAK